MTRVKRSVHARKKRRATLELTKGFRGEAHSNYKRAKEALMKADAYAYRDRRNRKRDFRRLCGGRERDRSGRFLAEGEDLIAAAEAAGRPALEGYRLAGCALGDGFHDVEPAALRAVSTLGSGTRVIGVYEQRWSAPVGPL